jgi:tetratricopeptide (TPR) repeat protein
MSKPAIPILRAINWLISRVAVIYVIVFLFCLTCVDLKTLNERIKVRHLNQAVPDFSDMINFSVGKTAKQAVDWAPYKDYFGLILRYLPDDVITKQLLGYVDFNDGQEQKAIDLFKGSALLKGHNLFWSNYDLGVIYYKRGMWPQAEEYLLRAVSSNPDLSMLLMKDSIIYRQICSSPAFIYNLDAGMNDAKSKAYLLLFSSLHKMGQYDKMISVFNFGISNQNFSYKDGFYYYAGLAFYETGQMDKAFLLFQKSLTLEKNDPDVYYYIANIYQKAGQLELARDFFQVSYALHQKNDPRFPYEAHVDLGFF